METVTYKVTGMTCGHCEKAVTEEIGAISGVTEVRVDLPTGHVTDTGETLADDAVREAVDEAGYELAGRV
ncbi:MAG TPA: heavy-metal-associated domain-containing protein [Phytomonospora sp.]